MADAVRNPLVNIDPRYFLTGDVVERPPAERPKHDTIDAIIDWLAGPAQHIPSLVSEFDEYAWRMLAAGFPLLRATLVPPHLAPAIPRRKLRLVAHHRPDRADLRHA